MPVPRTQEVLTLTPNEAGEKQFWMDELQRLNERGITYLIAVAAHSMGLDPWRWTPEVTRKITTHLAGSLGMTDRFRYKIGGAQ